MIMSIKLLDHGYINLVESWGSDARIIEAARMSTDKGFQGWGHECELCSGNGVLGSSEAFKLADIKQCENCKGSGKIIGDEKLLRFLWEHKHYTPFEMAGMIVEVQAPIFVFREWHRHRTQSYNELSARYTPLPDLFYMPSEERIKAGKQSKSNKQGSETGFNEGQAEEIEGRIANCYDYCREAYDDLLAMGVAREIARIIIPVGQYSRMRASANLRNWLAFLTLRMDKSAQWEIRQYANALADIVREKFPRTYELFEEGYVNNN